MKKKIRVGILFGGKSAEHEVSLVSARSIIQALDLTRYEPVLIGIDKQGLWHPIPTELFLQAGKSVQHASLPTHSEQITLVQTQSSGQLVGISSNFTQGLDVIFPVLHGTFGEDGTIQGLLKVCNIPFVGASVLGSAVGMDKDVMKRLLRDADIPIVPFMTILEKDKEKLSYETVVNELELPFFVKPANLGSSIGISKVHSKEEFPTALEKAFRFDRKILLEKGMNIRELECSVLGNDDKSVSVVGEIIPQHEFYDYEAKYIDENGAGLQIPAEITPEQLHEVQQLAIKACEVLCIDGMARVDFFLTKDSGKVYLNEVNTIPGFTPISMYPKLWEAAGVTYSELIDRLIQLAFDRHQKEQGLTVNP